MHAVDSSFAAYLPAPHELHSNCPYDDELPAGHTTHPSAPALAPPLLVLERPAAHGVHWVAALTLFVLLPAALVAW